MITETNVNIAIQESLNTLSRWKRLKQYSNSRIIAQFNSVLKNNIIRCCSGTNHHLKQSILSAIDIDCEFDEQMNLIDIHVRPRQFGKYGDNELCKQIRDFVKIKNIKEQPEVSNINFSSILNIQFNGK